MIGNYNHKAQIRLSADLVTRLDAQAKTETQRRGQITTRSDLIRELLDQHLPRIKPGRMRRRIEPSEETPAEVEASNVDLTPPDGEG